MPSQESVLIPTENENVIDSDQQAFRRISKDYSEFQGVLFSMNPFLFPSCLQDLQGNTPHLPLPVIINPEEPAC